MFFRVKFVVKTDRFRSILDPLAGKVLCDSPSFKTFFLSQTNVLRDPQVLPGVLLAGGSWATWLRVGEVVMIIPLPQGASKPL